MDTAAGEPPDGGQEGKYAIHLLAEADGGPVGGRGDGANRHDAKLSSATLEAVIVERPQPTPSAPLQWFPRWLGHPMPEQFAHTPATISNRGGRRCNAPTTVRLRLRMTRGALSERYCS